MQEKKIIHLEILKVKINFAAGSLHVRFPSNRRRRIHPWWLLGQTLLPTLYIHTLVRSKREDYRGPPLATERNSWLSVSGKPAEQTRNHDTFMKYGRCPVHCVPPLDRQSSTRNVDQRPTYLRSVALSACCVFLCVLVTFPPEISGSCRRQICSYACSGGSRAISAFPVVW